jgi:hypothetical protein
MTKNNSIINFFFFLFFLIFFISRLYYFAKLSEIGYFSYDRNEDIDEHFVDIFFRNNSETNGYLILLKFFYFLFTKNINLSLVFYFFNVSITIISFWFFFDIFKNYLNKILLILALSLISYFLIPYEFWRLDHHDHINLFIFTYILWAVHKVIFTGKYKNHFFFSLVLINLFYTLGFVSTFIALILMFFLVIKKKIFLIKYDYIKILFILCLIFFTFLKTFLNSHVASTTVMGGANLLQRTLHAIGEDKFSDLVENKVILPKGWLNIFNEIKKNNQNIDNIDTRISNIAHGTINNDFLQNFFIKSNILQINKDNNKIVFINDSDIFLKKPWIYNFGYRQTLLDTYFQSYSGFIFINALKFYPYEILIGQVGNKGLLLTSAQMLSFTGLFPYYYENQYFYSYTFNILLIKFFNYLFVIIGSISFFLIFKSTTKVLKKKNKKIDIFYLFTNLFLIIHVLFTSLITCCENPRIMIMFFFIIVSVIFLNLKFIFFKQNN